MILRSLAGYVVTLAILGGFGCLIAADYKAGERWGAWGGWMLFWHALAAFVGIVYLLIRLGVFASTGVWSWA